jgi:hypothetical protein
LGHSTATVIVRKDQVPAPVANNNTWLRVDNSLESRITTAAIKVWHEDEADRYDDPRAGAPKLLKPAPEELAWQKAEEAVDQRRGEVTAIVPLMDRRDYEKKEKTLNLVLSDADWREYMKGNSYDLLQKHIDILMPEQKDMVVSFEILNRPKNSFDNAAGWTIKSVVEADASGGKAKTVYLLVADGKTLKNEYTSQALARAAAVQVVKDYPNVLEVEVRAKIVREDNTSLVKVRRVVRSATAKLKVTYIKVKTATPRTENWLVGFDYHH